MHNLTKIRIFRVLLKLSWPPSILLIYPVILFRKKLSGRNVFFFDRYSLGGAQRVHVDILTSISDKLKLVLFTRSSPDDAMKSAFMQVPGTECRDIQFWCDNLLFRLFSVHYWAFYLNRHRNLKILGSNSTFFYDLLPWLRKDFMRIELLHNFTYGKGGMEHFGLANHQYVDKRLAVDHFTAQNIRDQYAMSLADVRFTDRIQVIEPGVAIPEQVPKKEVSPLKILYAGRGGPQKRVWLIDRIAAHCYAEKWPVEFHFAGDLNNELSQLVKEKSVMHGQISDSSQMQQLYARSHAIILTSAYEGFPMVIKEGMAYGCIPLVTALPGNKTHLRNGENALLIDAVEDEDGVVAEAISQIHQLLSKTALCLSLAASAANYSRAHFSKERFIDDYRSLLS